MMEKIKFITFQEVCAIISKMFQENIKGINADSLIKKAIKLGYEFELKKIPYWEGFENNQIYFKEEYLLNLIFETKDRTDDILVLTDECFMNDKMNQKVPIVNYRNLLEFSKKEYSNIYKKDGVGIEFFQCSDIIFVSTESNLINILHHDGIHLEIDTSKFEFQNGVF